MSRRCVMLACLVVTATVRAETLTLPLEERPDWVRRDGIVMAGSWEALPMRARIFGPHTYTPTAEQRAAFLREHSPEMIARLKDLGVNFVMIHCYRGAGFSIERASMDESAQFAQRDHEAGMRVGVYNNSGTLFWDVFFNEVPAARDWLVLDPGGPPIPYGAQTFRYYWNRNHPDAEAFFKTIVQFSVNEIKADLIHFDNYSIGPGWDANSVERFRQYLRVTFTPEQLKDMNIPDLDTARPPNETSPELLRRAWQKFCCRSMADSYWEMCRYARSLRSDILVELNAGGPGNSIVPPLDHGRLLQGGEAFWDEGGASGYERGQLRSRIRTFKIGRAMHNMVFAYTTTPLEMAESMAFNLDCLGCVCWYEFANVVERPYATQLMSPQLAPFICFFHQRRDLLRAAAVVADAAVLRSFPSQVFGAPQHARTTYAVEQSLIDHCGPFQILYDHQLGDLGRYRALVLAGCAALSDGQVAQIGQYVRAGGHVCALGPTATHDQWFVPRKQPALDDLPASHVVRASERDEPMAAIRQACGGELSLKVEAKLDRADRAAAVVAPGERLYVDRPYVISKVPEELRGLHTIRFSVDAAKADSLLTFRATVPVRVIVAFAKKGYSAQWLDPQPGWTIYQAGGFDSTIVDIGRGMDIYCRDVPAVEVRLFAGEAGNYVLLGIQATQPGFTDCPFLEGTPGGSAPGVCAELTEQPNRRLVHLVNYRSDGPIPDVNVSVRLPAGRCAKSVALASPERAHETPVSHQQQNGRVTFVIPQLGVYEIAVVTLEEEPANKQSLGTLP